MSAEDDVTKDGEGCPTVSSGDWTVIAMLFALVGSEYRCYPRRYEMTQPSHTNNHGTAFGGQIAAWGYLCCSFSTDLSNLVTASDGCAYLHPVHKGMVVILKSTVNCFGIPPREDDERVKMTLL